MLLIEILLSIDYFMTGAFTVEAIFKIIAFGFFFTRTSYLKDSWNILDFIIVISAITGFVLPEGINISAVKSLRILRILRPLKIIAKTCLSSTDPVREQKDGWCLEQENGHLQRSCLNKSCFRSYQLMNKTLKIVAKTTNNKT